MTDDDEHKDERKERVIHTRISETLDEEIRRQANSLGLSVSNLVRNVLLNTFGLVEDIGADLARVAGRRRSGPHAERERDVGGREDASSVVGWQDIVLGRNALCELCNAILSKGSQAAVAVRDGSGPRTIICPRCRERVTNDDGAKESGA